MPSLFSRSRSSNQLSSSRCPECGAPVDFRNIPREHTQVKCSYCGTLIAIPGRVNAEATRRPDVTPVVTTTITATSDGSVTASKSGCSGIGWSIIVICIIFGVFASTSTSIVTSLIAIYNNAIPNTSSQLPGSSSEPNNTTPSKSPAITLPNLQQMIVSPPRLSGQPILLNGNESAATQMVIMAYETDGGRLIGFDPIKRAETWRSATLGEKYYDISISSDAERVYLADEATLMALDRESGKLVWQSSLANNIQTTCSEKNSCLQHTGDQIIALSRDGTIQSFNGESGAPTWSRRMNSQPRYFLVNQDQVLIVDVDDANRASVLVLDASSGDLQFTLEPMCVFTVITMRPYVNDQFLITPDGSALVIVSSGTYACAWRYSLDDGALLWNYTPPGVNGPLPFTWSSSTFVMNDPYVYFTNTDGKKALVYELDTQSAGAVPQVIYEVTNYDIAVQSTIGDLLLVSGQPTYARDEMEIWAIDLNSGERHWQRKLGTTHSFDEWLLYPTDQGIFKMVCSWNNDDCSFETLDLDTGTSQGQIREDTGRPFNGMSVRGNQGFLTIDGKIYAIDLHTAKISYAWP